MKIKSALTTVLLSGFLVMVGVRCSKPGDEPVQPDPPPPPPAVKPGVLKGTIINEFNQLLAGALVHLKGSKTDTTVRTTNGHYLVGALPPGAYSLTVQKDGYIEAAENVSITTGDTLTKDFSLKAGVAELRLLSDSVVIAKPFASSFFIKIASNTAWSIDNSNDWLLPARQGSSGDDSVVVRVSAWKSDAPREGVFYVHAGNLRKKVTVRQLPEVRLQSVTPLPGNGAFQINDSIALEFNQPVTVKNLIPGYDLCQSDMGFSQNGSRVTFRYNCAALGGTYPFTIVTNNSTGDQYTFTFSVDFYKENLDLKGAIKSYFVNDADHSYWVLTENPEVLYKIDMTSLKILHQYKLQARPAMFTVSPYNNKIYISYWKDPNLYVLNQDGTTHDVITMKADPARAQYERDGPRIYPVKLTFAKNGKGMIWLSDRDEYSYNAYWFIDAAADHKVWYQELPGAEGNYQRAEVNYDKTKIVLTYMDMDARVGIFDTQTMSFSSFKPGRTDIKGFVTPSRKNGNIYIGQLYFQSVYNTATGVETAAVNHDNRSGGNVDFYYRAGKDQTVYFTETGTIRVTDYATGKTMVRYDAVPYLQGITATLDGKYVLVHRHDGNYNSRVIQLPAEWFNY